jgi:hypothetical protein
MVTKRRNLFIWPVVFAVITLSIILDAAQPIRTWASFVLLFVLPGWLLIGVLDRRANLDLVERFVAGSSVSYALVIVTGLGLLAAGHFTVGGWLVAIGAMVIFLVVGGVALEGGFVAPALSGLTRRQLAALACIALLAAGLRFSWLGFSDLQGDEVNATSLGWSLARHDWDAVFRYHKGPAEGLISGSMMLLSDSLAEIVPRLPFAWAGVLIVATVALLTRRLFGPQAGLWAFVLAASNGLLIAFSRIVQYQNLVMLLSLLAFWGGWMLFKTGQWRWLVMGTLCLLAATLAHYDGLAVGGCLLYWIACHWTRSQRSANDRAYLVGVGFLVLTLFGAAAVVWASTPHFLDSTVIYLTRRIGLEGFWIRNNLPELFRRLTLYSSVYYAVFLGLGAALAVWMKLRAAPGRMVRWAALVGLVLLVGLSGFPGVVANAFAAAICGGLAILVWRQMVSPPERALWLWAVLPSGVYIFLVADPRTHFYALMIPAIVLVAALAFTQPEPALCARLWKGGAGALTLLAFGYASLVYLPPAAENDAMQGATRFLYPAWGHSSIGFGSVHRQGWQTIGHLVRSGQLSGDYGSNETRSFIDWYTQGLSKNPCYPRYWLIDSHQPGGPDATNLADYSLVGEVVTGQRSRLKIFEFDPFAVKAGSARLWQDSVVYADRFASLPMPQPRVPEIPELDQPVTFSVNRDFLGELPPDLKALAIELGLADQVELRGYEVDTTWAQKGGRVSVKLLWYAPRRIAVDYKVFVHMIRAGEIVAQADDWPMCGQKPTNQWREGDWIFDQHLLRLPTDLAAGTFDVVAGVYEPRFNLRLGIQGPDGQFHGTQAYLATISVRE